MYKKGRHDPGSVELTFYSKLDQQYSSSTEYKNSCVGHQRIPPAQANTLAAQSCHRSYYATLFRWLENKQSGLCVSVMVQREQTPIRSAWESNSQLDKSGPRRYTGHLCTPPAPFSSFSAAGKDLHCPHPWSCWSNGYLKSMKGLSIPTLSLHKAVM